MSYSKPFFGDTFVINLKNKIKKLLLGLGLVAISLLSCEKQNEAKQEEKEEVKEDLTPKLYLTKSIVKAKLGSGEESKTTKETYVFSNTYIELSATKSTKGGYQAQYQLPTEEGSDGITTVGYLLVTDKGGNTLFYETPSEFLNYMDGMGYGMATEKSHKYGKIYTFKNKMKNLIYILFILFTMGMVTTTFAQFGDVEKSYVKTPDKQEYNNTIMFQSHIPTSPFGIKYAYLGNIGGYVAFTTDFGRNYEVYQLTVGITKKVSSIFNIYLGYGRDFSWGESVIDAGIIYRKNRFALGVGFGVNVDDPEYSYGSLGIGYNF